jgi:hypothetical protein
VEEVRQEVEVDSVLGVAVEEVVEGFRGVEVGASHREDEVEVPQGEADLGEDEARFGSHVWELLHLAFGSCVQYHSCGIGQSIKLNGIVPVFSS